MIQGPLYGAWSEWGPLLRGMHVWLGWECAQAQSSGTAASAALDSCAWASQLDN